MSPELQNTCAADEFCESVSCDAADAPGTCVKKPAADSCPVYFVCPRMRGCDGETYCDVFSAHAAGVSVVLAVSGNTGGSGQQCDVSADAQYPAGMVCAFAASGPFGPVDATGVCKPAPDLAQ